VRDPKRIPQIMSEFESFWNQYPDLRFFQVVDLLANLAGYPEDPYYCEDDDLLKELEIKNEDIHEK